jgi:hypothetical protein
LGGPTPAGFAAGFFFTLPVTLPRRTAGLWAENADEVGVDADAIGVPGDEYEESGEEDLSCSRKEAVDDSRSLDGTFE